MSLSAAELVKLDALGDAQQYCTRGWSGKIRRSCIEREPNETPWCAGCRMNADAARALLRLDGRGKWLAELRRIVVKHVVVPTVPGGGVRRWQCVTPTGIRTYPDEFDDAERAVVEAALRE